MKTYYLCLFLISTTSALSSSFHSLSWFRNTTSPTRIDNVADGSNIYLSSSDKALALSKITLTTKGQSITLEKLLSRFDDHGYKIGWPVYSDLTISTTNNENVTKALHGSIFITTPTMAQDPNFLVYVVRGNTILDRTPNDNTTIVFLSVHTVSAGSPTYAGFTHTRIDQIVQPRSSELYFYRGNPDDMYGDIDNVDTLNKKIFSNPLKFFPTEHVPSSVFFDNIDPIQYSLNVFFMRAIGGVKMTVSDTYVDTTNINCTSITTTGMSNSQLFAYNSSVNFVSIRNNLGTTGFITTTELTSNSNITFTMNGNGMTDSLIAPIDENNRRHIVNWAADNLMIYPASLIPGIYWIQYFKIDGGAPTTTTFRTTPTTPAPTSSPASSSSAPSTATSSSPAPPSSSASTAPPSSTTQTVQSTTKSAVTSLSMFSLSVSSLYLFLRV